MHGDMDAAGDVAGAGGVVTTSPAVEMRAEGTREGQHQQHPSGHAPQDAGGETIPSADPADAPTEPLAPKHPTFRR
jgi:hypothetical protein